jgi:hypothetical protein
MNSEKRKTQDERRKTNLWNIDCVENSLSQVLAHESITMPHIVIGLTDVKNLQGERAKCPRKINEFRGHNWWWWMSVHGF